VGKIQEVRNRKEEASIKWNEFFQRCRKTQRPAGALALKVVILTVSSGRPHDPRWRVGCGDSATPGEDR